MELPHPPGKSLDNRKRELSQRTDLVPRYHNVDHKAPEEEEEEEEESETEQGTGSEFLIPDDLFSRTPVELLLKIMGDTPTNLNLKHFQNLSLVQHRWKKTVRDDTFWDVFMRFQEEYILAILPGGKWYVENLHTLKTKKMELFKQFYLQYDYLIQTPSHDTLKIRQVNTRGKMLFHYDLKYPFKLQAHGAHHFAGALFDALKPTKMMVPSPRIDKNGKHFYNCTEHSERLKFTDTIDIEPFLFVSILPDRIMNTEHLLDLKISNLLDELNENATSATILDIIRSHPDLRSFLAEAGTVPDISKWTAGLSAIKLKNLEKLVNDTISDINTYIQELTAKKFNTGAFPQTITRALDSYKKVHSIYPRHTDLMNAVDFHNRRPNALLFGVHLDDIKLYMEKEGGTIEEFLKNPRNNGPLIFHYLGPTSMYDNHRLVKSGMLEISFSVNPDSPFKLAPGTPSRTFVVGSEYLKVATLSDMDRKTESLGDKKLVWNTLATVPQKQNIDEQKYPLYLDITKNYDNLGNTRLSSMLEHRTLSILGAQSDVIRALDGKFQGIVTRQDERGYIKYLYNIIHQCRANGLSDIADALAAEVFDTDDIVHENENMGTDYDYITNGTITDIYYRMLLFAWSRELIKITERASELVRMDKRLEQDDSSFYITSKKADQIALENIMSSLKHTNLPVSSYIKSYVVVPFSIGKHSDQDHPILRNLFDRNALVPLHHPSSSSNPKDATPDQLVKYEHPIPFIAFIKYVVVDHWQKPNPREKAKPHPRKYGRKIFQMLQQVERIHDQLTDNEYAFVLKIYISAERKFNEHTLEFEPPLFADHVTSEKSINASVLEHVIDIDVFSAIPEYVKSFTLQRSTGPENIVDAQLKCYKRKYSLSDNPMWDRYEGIKRSEQEVNAYIKNWDEYALNQQKAGNMGTKYKGKKYKSMRDKAQISGLNYPQRFETTNRYMEYGLNHWYDLDGSSRRDDILQDLNSFKNNYTKLKAIKKYDVEHISRLLRSSNINVMVPVSACSISALLNTFQNNFDNNPYGPSTEEEFLAQDEKIRSKQFDLFLTEWMVDRNGVYLGRESLNAKKIGKWENTLDYSRLLFFSGMDSESNLSSPYYNTTASRPFPDGLNVFSYYSRTGLSDYNKGVSLAHPIGFIDYSIDFIYSFAVAQPSKVKYVSYEQYYTPQMVILPFDRSDIPRQPIAVVAGTTPIETRIKGLDTEPKYIKHGIHIYLRDANSREEALLCKFCKRERATLKCIHHLPNVEHHHHPNHNQRNDYEPIPFCSNMCSEQYCVLHC